MKHITQVFVGMALIVILTAGTHGFRRTTSHPVLTVASVTVPADTSQPLIVRLQLSVRDGVDPVAVSSEWLTIRISTPKDESKMVFDGKVLFVGTTNTIAAVRPGATNDVQLAADSDRFTKKSWADLPSGKYRLRVYLNSSKTADRDYQWLGQTYSPGYDFEIKVIPNKVQEDTARVRQE